MPGEIISQGFNAIKNYFEELEKEGEDFLYEAKLVVLGESGVGKTTFAKKVINEHYQLRDEDTTHGIEVYKWSFKHNRSDNDIDINIWDFGGQEIYHATHQFFISGRSIYTVVSDSRKEDTDFNYWRNRLHGSTIPAQELSSTFCLMGAST